jgi:cytochrome c oxidase subunit 3
VSAPTDVGGGLAGSAASAPGSVRRAPKAHLRRHFQDLDQQAHAAQLGMWAFLASEVLFFTGFFTLYAAYRVTFPDVFARAVTYTDLWLGTANTYVLVIASYLVALAVGAIRKDRPKRSSWLLASASGLGVLFLVLKGIEYAHHFREGIYPGAYYHFDKLHGPGARVFFSLYYLMTGLHAIHVIGGIVVLGVLAWRARRGHYSSEWNTPIELGGLYWHFVDIVWLFLWPMFYLMK